MYYSLNNSDSVFSFRGHLLCIFVFFVLVNCVLTTGLIAQCTPTITAHHSNETQSLCQSDSPVELSVDVTVDKGRFIGQGIIDSDSTDNKALFDPSKVPAGNHTIGFVVLEEGSSPCKKGDNASLSIQVLPYYKNNPIGEVTICADGINQVSLIDYLSTRVHSDGIWNTISGITPTSRSGTLTPEQLQQLEGGIHLFTYIDSQYKDHANCPTVAVKLHLIKPPTATKIDSIEAVCEGDRAYVCVDGLADGYYTAKYSIGLEEMPISERFIAINGKALFMTTELSSNQQQQPLYIKSIVNAQTECHQAIKGNRLVGKVKLKNDNYQ